jgi:hypothetical protein
MKHADSISLPFPMGKGDDVCNWAPGHIHCRPSAMSIDAALKRKPMERTIANSAQKFPLPVITLSACMSRKAA